MLLLGTPHPCNVPWFGPSAPLSGEHKAPSVSVARGLCVSAAHLAHRGEIPLFIGLCELQPAYCFRNKDISMQMTLEGVSSH